MAFETDTSYCVEYIDKDYPASESKKRAIFTSEDIAIGYAQEKLESPARYKKVRLTEVTVTTHTNLLKLN